MKKKIVAMILSLIMVLGVAGCGDVEPEIPGQKEIGQQKIEPD